MCVEQYPGKEDTVKGERKSEDEVGVRKYTPLSSNGGESEIFFCWEANTSVICLFVQQYIEQTGSPNMVFS